MTGVPMDDLLMAVGSTQLRTPKTEIQKKKADEKEGLSGSMVQLAELAFRLGHNAGAVTSSSSNSVTSQLRQPAEVLAIEDRKPETFED